MGGAKITKPPVVLTKMRGLSKRKKDTGRSKSPGNSQAEISTFSGAITAKTVGASGNPTGDLMQLDAFYQDLIQSERAQFERILKSKCNLTRSSTNTQLNRHMNVASEKY